MLKKYGMFDTRTSSTPLGCKHKLSKVLCLGNEEERNLINIIPYASVVEA